MSKEDRGLEELMYTIAYDLDPIDPPPELGDKILKSIKVASSTTGKWNKSLPLVAALLLFLGVTTYINYCSRETQQANKNNTQQETHHHVADRSDNKNGRDDVDIPEKEKPSIKRESVDKSVDNRIVTAENKVTMGDKAYRQPKVHGVLSIPTPNRPHDKNKHLRNPDESGSGDRPNEDRDSNNNLSDPGDKNRKEYVVEASVGNYNVNVLAGGNMVRVEVLNGNDLVLARIR
jgi:hypothetical protein